jgi:MFS family permease
MKKIDGLSPVISRTNFFTFIAVMLFYMFESAQMAYYNVLAPFYDSQHGYNTHMVASISAAYYYGCMVGLFPVGYILDNYSIRKSMLIAILGSVFGIFLLSVGQAFYVQWIARFICGLLGGTFCFLGGIRIIALLFPNRFSYYMGIFLAGGMFGGMVCQYPLLLLVKKFGPVSAIQAMLAVGVVVFIFNIFYLQFTKPVTSHQEKESVYTGTFWEMCKEIGFNLRNWCDVIMVSLLDTPVSIIGTLWGIVFLMNFYHFDAVVSSWIVMSMFMGLIIGLPIIGHVADKYHNPPWIITLGALFSLAIILLLAKLQTTMNNAWWVGLLFFGLGFFSSCQTMGFTWLTSNMKKELIGRNSALNSMAFMGINGIFKQLGAFLLGVSALLFGEDSSANLILILAVSMLLAAIYASIRNLFDIGLNTGKKTSVFSPRKLLGAKD